MKRTLPKNSARSQQPVSPLKLFLPSRRSFFDGVILVTLLASNVNLVTHYAKGTLLFKNTTRAAYKTTISIVPLRY